MTEYNSVAILLVEDDLGHSRLIEKNLRRGKITNEIRKFDDGQKVLDYLFDRQEDIGAPHKRPMVILLDLNLPVVDGYEVLRRIKSNENTKDIPVIVLTTTDSPYEIKKCYDFGCNIYITKPVEYEQFSTAIQKLGLFLTVVQIPGHAGCR